MDRLTPYADAITKLCETHRVSRLYAFGSVLTDKFDKDSDVDLIVDFANVDVDSYAENYFDLKVSLQTVLKRPVDLLEDRAIRNPYFKQAIDQQKQLIYER